MTLLDQRRPMPITAGDLLDLAQALRSSPSALIHAVGVHIDLMVDAMWKRANPGTFVEEAPADLPPYGTYWATFRNEEFKPRRDGIPRSQAEILLEALELIWQNVPIRDSDIIVKVRKLVQETGLSTAMFYPNEGRDDRPL